jgi:predicted Zn-dependent protease
MDITGNSFDSSGLHVTHDCFGLPSLTPCRWPLDYVSKIIIMTLKMRWFESFMRFKRMIARFLLAFFIICTLSFLSPRGAGAELTLEDERKLGKEIYDKLASHDLILKNPRVTRYVESIGYQILAQSKKVPFDFKFFVMKSSAINAFATPGGYIYVNSGLILVAENESEFASVLAHEIGHANARHIADIIEKSTKVNIATLVGVLAAAVLGGGSPEAMAVATFSMAAGATMQLKYSREHEEEADRFGMAYLTGAGYDPQSMPDFLKVMRRNEFYSNSVPSYFLTHPGTDERIRYLDGLIQIRYNRRGHENIIGGFRRIQTILRLNDKDEQSALRYFKNEAEKNPPDVDALFGLAMTQAKLGQMADALTNFNRALQLSPKDPDVLRGLGKSLVDTGRAAEAVVVLEKAYAVDANDLETAMSLGRAYEQTGNYQAALAVFQKAEEKNSDDENVYYHLATSYGYLNNPGESHYYFGNYFKKKRKTDSALFHFREALKYAPPGSARAVDIQRQIETLSRKEPPKAGSPEPESSRRPRFLLPRSPN